jgi:hypothetical protein
MSISCLANVELSAMATAARERASTFSTVDEPDATSAEREERNHGRAARCPTPLAVGAAVTKQRTRKSLCIISAATGGRMIAGRANMTSKRKTLNAADLGVG